MVDDVQTIVDKLQMELNSKRYPGMTWKLKQNKKKDIDCFYLINHSGRKHLDNYCYKVTLDMLQEHFNGQNKDKDIF